MSSSIEIEVEIQLISPCVCPIFRRSSSKIEFFSLNLPTFDLFNEEM